LRGSIEVAGATLEKFRLVAGAIGIVIFALMILALNRTKLGLLIRAGVQNTELVECMGYRIKALFVAVFAGGCALAGTGGAMWGMYQQVLSLEMGTNMFILIFIVLNIGGMGSVGGALLGALLIGLLTNYANFLAPKLALVSSLLLLAAILAWRPNGLYKMAED
jgi:branched-chain amino acid transport system permease protein